MNCRHCKHSLSHIFLDLGTAPPSNAYLSVADLTAPELHFPLKLYVCEHCWLVQTHDHARANELFRDDYAYFSSTSQTWLEHATRYFKMISRKLKLTAKSFVLEIASNDGYLLKNFVSAGIPCLGIEPTASTAAAAEKLGVPVLRDFFSKAMAERFAAQGKQADLIIGNNVFAHVPNINDFTAGIKAALKPGGVVTLEFPHLMRLIENNQFDTVYHEHYSYLSLYTVKLVLEQNGLRIWDVEELSTHGGSLRVYGCNAADPRKETPSIIALLNEEERHGMRRLSVYQDFQVKADRVKDNLLLFLIEQKRAGKRVAGYGAAAKGNTLLNYAGVKPDLLPYVCDAAPSKQGKYLPGSHIPIVPPETLQKLRPDSIIILPWNIEEEVKTAHAYVRDWGGRFAVAVPSLRFVG